MTQCKQNQASDTFKFGRSDICCALLVAFGPAWCMQASAQAYVNYDGSRTNDVNAATRSWTEAAEFKLHWGLGAINAQHAYAAGFSGAGVKIGAVDSGYLATHREFADRGITAVTVSGNYSDAGAQLGSSSDTWTAGQPFLRGPVVGTFIPGVNDNHGTHVSGTIAAARNGVDTMGVAFGSQYYTSNTNGSDASTYGSNMDYNYFKAAYGNLAAAGVRVINSSWGSPPHADDYGTVTGLSEAYGRLNSAGKKSWLDAAADVTLAQGVMQVFAAGNAGKSNINVRSAAPYFRPELEKHWVSVAALSPDLTLAPFSNRCGVAKYWCISAPGVDVYSASVAGNDQHAISSGTSMAAPHITGALGVLMERYPYLGNEEIRTILLTTASARGDGPAGVPDANFGWGVADLKKAMNGPAQFLGMFVANLPGGSSDTWSNSISDTAWQQRKREERAEVAGWAAEKTVRESRLQALPQPASADQVAGVARGKLLLQEEISASTAESFDFERFFAALDAIAADPHAAALQRLYNASNHNRSAALNPANDFDNFIAGRSDAEIAAAIVELQREEVQTGNAAIQGSVALGEARIAALQAKTDADYAGGLLKGGSGSLTLTGSNTYSGATVVLSGALRAGAVNTFSAASAMTVHSGATLDLAGYSQRIAGMTNAGVVSLQGAVPGTVLTVTGPWVGRNGVLRLGALGAGEPDRVVLSGSTAIATGHTKVQFAGTAGLGAPSVGRGIEVVGTVDGASVQADAFALDGDHIDAGAYRYRLINSSSGSHLSSFTAQGQPNYRGEVVLTAALPSQLRAGSLAMLANARQRVGDDDVGALGSPSAAATDLGGNGRRAWGRVISTGMDIEQQGTVSPGSTSRSRGFQAGTDLLSMSSWRTGLYVGQLDGDATVRGFAEGLANLSVGTNDLRSQYLGFYGSYAGDDGFYVDAVLQAGRHRYTLQPSQGAGIPGKGGSTLASLEAGRAFALGRTGWTMEPQLQLIHHRQRLDDGNLAGTHVQMRPESGWVARAGARVKGEIATALGALQPYGRLNVYKRFKGTDLARFANPSAITDIATPTGGTSAELAAGFTLALSKNSSLYGEFGKLWATAGASRTGGGINGSVGVRARW
jgi:outer membrane autotransporter protein